jgi:hypothetical protein
MAHIKLRDMDTISVMKTKQYAAMDANKKNGVETPLSPIGSKLSERCRCPSKMAQDFIYAGAARNSGKR